MHALPRFRASAASYTAASVVTLTSNAEYAPETICQARHSSALASVSAATSMNSTFVAPGLLCSLLVSEPS